MKQKLLIAFVILGVIFLGFIVFTIRVMGDRFCKIELQNTTRENLSIKTIKATGGEWKIIIDSVSLKPNEKFEIGDCINCQTLKQSDFDFDGIVLFINGNQSKLIHRKDLPEYLSKLQRVECATFEVR